MANISELGIQDRIDMILEAHEMGEALPDKDHEFVTSLRDRGVKELTESQEKWLFDIEKRIFGGGE